MTDHLTTWGLFDTVDNVWMGNDAGPKPFADHMLARIAARIACVQLGWDPKRLEVRPLPSGSWREHDRVKTRMRSLTALKKLERGTVL